MKKKTAVTAISVLSVFLAIAIAVAGVSIARSNKNEEYMAANYRHAFAELVTGVSEMDNALQKSLLVTSPSMAGAVCTEVFAKSQTAGMALGALPFSYAELEKTVSFINTVGDFAFSMSQKAGRGDEFTQEDKDALKSLSETASNLAMTLKGIQDGMGSATVSIKEYASSLSALDEQEGEFIPQTLADNVKVSEQEFPELPSLIYDGPFSEHLKTSSPKFLEGREEVDEIQGRRAAASFIGARFERVYPTAEQEGLLPAYCYAADVSGNQMNVWVSKTGGIVFGAMNSRAVTSTQLSAKEALDAAKKMLERWGYGNMKESYYLISNNVMTANFAYEQDGVICYPDLIKVGIAMDNGSLQTFEASGYISSHYEREIPEPGIAVEQAREKVPAELKITEENKTIIPSPGKYEVFCYEFKCEQEDGRKFIIYVNAVTGEQEKILIILEDDNGTLTI